MNNRVPPLLSCYINKIPSSSLTLLTGLLGATTNWLIVRYLYAALSQTGNATLRNETTAYGIPRRAGSEDDDGDITVVLVSWMRDFEFWRGEARRAVGLDLVRLQAQGRLVFIDGLTHLFVPPPVTTPAQNSTTPQTSTTSSTNTSLPTPQAPQTASIAQRGTISPVPNRRSLTSFSRGDSSHATRPPGSIPTPGAVDETINEAQPAPGIDSATTNPPSTIYLTSPSLTDTKRTILAAIDSLATRDTASTLTSNSAQNHTSLQSPPTAPTTPPQPRPPRKILLILDHPSLLFPFQDPLSNMPSPSTTLLNTILTFRSHPSIHNTILSLPSDEPFLTPALLATNTSPSSSSSLSSTATSGTPLETETSAFLVASAQIARHVLSCRRLGTGWAGDVSGVVRVTRGGAFDADDGKVDDKVSGFAMRAGAGQAEAQAEREGEWLYFIGGDGSVKVWSRGAAIA